MQAAASPQSVAVALVLLLGAGMATLGTAAQGPVPASTTCIPDLYSWPVQRDLDRDGIPAVYTRSNDKVTVHDDGSVTQANGPSYCWRAGDPDDDGVQRGSTLPTLPGLPVEPPVPPPEASACTPDPYGWPYQRDVDRDGVPAIYTKVNDQTTVHDDGSITQTAGPTYCWIVGDLDDDGQARPAGASPVPLPKTWACTPDPYAWAYARDADGDGLPALYTRVNDETTVHPDGSVRQSKGPEYCWLIGDPDDDRPKEPFVTVPSSGPVRFIVAGDTGTGAAGQYAVAAAIGEVCAARGCAFMTILGDLIYESGTTSPYDPQFVSKFERPYEDLGFPIYTVLGNHDNSNDPYAGATLRDMDVGHWYEAGTNEVLYHYRHDRLSEKWQMPDRSYSVRYGDVEIFALDTNTMMYGDIATGSTRASAYRSALLQASWFDAAVAQSDATWKFAMGHHPYVSNGVHGDAGHYDDADGPAGEMSTPGTQGDGVRLFFDTHLCASGAIDVYFAGHDHDLQWLKPVPECGATEFIVSGAGSKTRGLEESPVTDSYFGRGGSLGFFWVEIDGDQFTAVAFNDDGDVLYQRSFDHP